MATGISTFPGQQQVDPGAVGGIGQPSDQQAATSSTGGGHYTSGSIGQFFGVITVLVILSVLSCFLGRICTRNGKVLMTPLDNIGFDKGLGWVKRKCRWFCRDRDVEVEAGKVVDHLGEKGAADGGN